MLWKSHTDFSVVLNVQNDNYLFDDSVIHVDTNK